MRPRRRGFRFCIFPGYNWCGPGCNGPGPPTNEVDAACRDHDYCYRRHYDKCACDREFLRRLRFSINPYTQKGRHARIMYEYMKLQTLFRCGPGPHW